MARYKNLYTTEYFEEYARLCLNDLFSVNLIHRKERYYEDRPDLISREEIIGVEVTEGKTQEDGRKDKLFQQEYPEGKDGSEAKQKEAGRLGLENVKCINGQIIQSYNISLKNSLERILNALIKKLNNLNSKTYNIYKSNQLFIFANHTHEDDINKIKTEILKEQENFKRKFNKIYLLTNDKLYCIENKIFNTFKISSEKLKKFKQDARKNTAVVTFKKDTL